MQTASEREGKWVTERNGTSILRFTLGCDRFSTFKVCLLDSDDLRGAHVALWGWQPGALQKGSHKLQPGWFLSLKTVGRMLYFQHHHSPFTSLFPSVQKLYVKPRGKIKAPRFLSLRNPRPFPTAKPHLHAKALQKALVFPLAQLRHRRDLHLNR